MIKRFIEAYSTFHNIVSLLKSLLRIAAGLSLVESSILWAGIFLILAEILGIIEEV